MLCLKKWCRKNIFLRCENCENKFRNGGALEIIVTSDRIQVQVEALPYIHMWCIFYELSYIYIYIWHILLICIYIYKWNIYMYKIDKYINILNPFLCFYTYLWTYGGVGMRMHIRKVFRTNVRESVSPLSRMFTPPSKTLRKALRQALRKVSWKVFWIRIRPAPTYL